MLQYNMFRKSAFIRLDIISVTDLQYRNVGAIRPLWKVTLPETSVNK